MGVRTGVLVWLGIVIGHWVGTPVLAQGFGAPVGRPVPEALKPLDFGAPDLIMDLQAVGQPCIGAFTNPALFGLADGFAMSPLPGYDPTSVYTLIDTIGVGLANELDNVANVVYPCPPLAEEIEALRNLLDTVRNQYVAFVDPIEARSLCPRDSGWYFLCDSTPTGGFDPVFTIAAFGPVGLSYSEGRRIDFNIRSLAYPEVVALVGDGFVHCTGILIAPRFVLSAAHCFDRGLSLVYNGRKLGGDPDGVFAGHKYEAHSPITAIVDVHYPLDRTETVHETILFDLAILELDSPVETHVFDLTPTKLASASQPIGMVITSWSVAEAGTLAVAVGFGTATGSLSDVGGTKRHGHLRVQHVQTLPDECPNCRPETASFFVSHREGAPMVEVCTRDSGGPLFLPGPTDDSQLVLAGIAHGFARGLSCGYGSAFTRTDTPEVLDWLAEVVGF